MAHEITKTDTFGEVRKGRSGRAGFGENDLAWHGLGVELQPGLTVGEGFKQLGLAWDTHLAEVNALYTDPFTQERHVVVSNEHKAHIRLDTRDILGIVSNDYKPVSNQEMAEFADALVGADAAVRLETGGSLRGGRRVFALVKLPRDTEVIGEDVVRNYVCISNGHDGLNAFRCFFTPIRVVCANTLAMAEANIRGARFVHDGDVRKKIELAQAALGIVVKRSEAFAEHARLLAKFSLTKASIDEYFKKTYIAMFGPVRENDNDEPEKSQKGRTLQHYAKITDEWRANMSNPKNTVKQTEGTIWHAFNAVTFWNDHQRGRLKDVAESTARVHSNLFGVSNRDKQIALREATNLAHSMT